jgi:alkanesulfonate monooxygenase SsuD/methylene tetrahydromethanopterin reductase-like flavin-dependent oxidoreductase (luciferase family)
MAGTIRFGLFTHIEKTSGAAALNELYGEHLSFIAEAEQAGFWCFHLAEHHATPLSMTPSPALFLAAASQRTKKIRLGAMVFLLPFYNPLRLVNEIAMLDNLTDGRLEVGVGRGISQFEHAYFGNPILETNEMFEDALAAVVKGLVNDRLLHHGPYYRYHNVPIEVRPMQKPYPGLWYGMTTPNSAGFAGRNRMNAVATGPTAHARETLRHYHEISSQHRGAAGALNAHVAEPCYGVQRHLVIADTDAEAETLGRAAYRTYSNNIQKLWSDFGVRDLRVGYDYESMRRGGSLIDGSPGRVAEELAGQLEKLPANYMVFNMKFGNLTARQSHRSLELFATEVKPALERRS